MSTFAAFSCTHIPFHDPDAVDWAICEIAELRPDVTICLGDCLESAASSRWSDSGEADHTLEYEFSKASEILGAIREYGNPHGRHIFMPGNHDDNLLRPGRIPKSVRPLCDWRPESHSGGIKELANWEIVAPHYERCATLGTFRMGQVCFAHGWSCSKAGVRKEAREVGELPYSLYVHGHTHRPHSPEQVLAGGIWWPYWVANAGTLRDLNPVYMTRCRKEEWGHALTVGEVRTEAVHTGRREWSAETIVKCLYPQQVAVA